MLSVIKLSNIMLCVIMLNIVMLSVIMLNVVKQSVVAPNGDGCKGGKCQHEIKRKYAPRKLQCILATTKLFMVVINCVA
jgi:hypothetical protein